MARTTAGEAANLPDSNDLLADSASPCTACGQEIRAGWVVRVTPSGTRHDVCP